MKMKSSDSVYSQAPAEPGVWFLWGGQSDVGEVASLDRIDPQAIHDG
jgi:hypothetical protein